MDGPAPSTSSATDADPAYGQGGGRAGGFHNIDELNLGKILQISYGRKRSGGKKKSVVGKLRTKGFNK